VEDLKIRLLDSIGCAIGAMGGEPMRMIRAQVDDFGGEPHCTLIGGGKTAPDRAALYNGALIRYLDFNDSYLAKGETCHPSDNIGAVLAAAEYARRDGRELLTALAVAYQVQCRLSDEAPVRAKGFDHTTQGSYAVASGVSRALGLNARQTANALAIAGTAFNALRVTRTGALSHWKGLAFPNTGFSCTHAAFLAMRGVTGPSEVFEGNKGFMETIAGPFDIDWSREGLDRVRRTIIKKYNAEIHSQSTIEGALELQAENGFPANEIEHIHIDTFDVAFHIIGGGEEGSKMIVRTKEEADHSLPYMVAAALLDGQVLPAQYEADRILRADVQQLLRKVTIRANKAYSSRFPDVMACRIDIELKDGSRFFKDKLDYEGFHSRPMGWAAARAKFDALTRPLVDARLSAEISDAVKNLENLKVADLTALLGKARHSEAG
ncbi:MAG: MmgE/PrpD family protein, partial [Desulfobacterales bacterium]